MKILVACEMSGIVRDEFIAAGHDAWSCDIIDSERPGPHIKGDVSLILEDGWDMMIAFPPCTYLCSSGLHWNKRRPHRALLTFMAQEFFLSLFYAQIPRIAIENPIGCMSTQFRKPDQIIQPWQFGHPESKSTCLWLKGLPKLTPTNVLEKPSCGYWSNQTPSRQNKLGPSAKRATERSRTYLGIAKAMADQWK